MSALDAGITTQEDKGCPQGFAAGSTLCPVQTCLPCLSRRTDEWAGDFAAFLLKLSQVTHSDKAIMDRVKQRIVDNEGDMRRIYATAPESVKATLLRMSLRMRENYSDLVMLMDLKDG